MLYLCAKTNSTNHFKFYTRSNHFYEPTLFLAMSGLLPVTPIIYPGKTKNAISQQLMGRFRSSLEELKPYPYASEIAISNYTKLNIHCVKVTYLFSWTTPSYRYTFGRLVAIGTPWGQSSDQGCRLCPKIAIVKGDYFRSPQAEKIHKLHSLSA